MHDFAREYQSTWCKNFLPRIRFATTIPCKILRHKSNTFHSVVTTLHMFMLIKFPETSIDKTNKIYYKSYTVLTVGWKRMFKMSTIHTNTCAQTTTPLRNRHRDDGVVHQSPLHQRTFLTPSHHESANGTPFFEGCLTRCSNRIQIWRTG